MAYDRYATQFTDKDGNVYGVMDEEARKQLDLVEGGYNPDMVVGGAEHLVSKDGVADTALYGLRRVPDGAGQAYQEKIVGGTVAWNQFMPELYQSGTQSNITITNNGDGSLTLNGTATSVANVQLDKSIFRFPVNHVFVAGLGTDIPSTSYLSISGIRVAANGSGYGMWKNTQYEVGLHLRIDYANGTVFNNLKVWPQVFDLTQMFGSTIADAIYAMEQATAGAGVAWFRKLFPASYYAYNAGELISVNALSHKTVGFNQWDEEWEVGGLDVSTGGNSPFNTRIRSKNYINVIPNANYCFYFGSIGLGAARVICYYDYNKKFISGSWVSPTNNLITIPANAHYIRFSSNDDYGKTYKNDICISLSSDRNGEYEPYSAHTYPFADLTLRGIPKLENGELGYDGDTYLPDGTVMRRFGVFDLGSVTWEYYTSGANPCFIARIPTDMKTYAYGSTSVNMICSMYKCIPADGVVAFTNNANNMTLAFSTTGSYVNRLLVQNTSYTDGAAFKAAMSGVYLIYELATPTTEQADPFNPFQILDPYGTEEFLSGTIVPVGHSTRYQADVVKTMQREIDTALICPTASGAIASFADGADGLKLRELNVAVEPVQDLHGYDAPWPGGGGKNKCFRRDSSLPAQWSGITVVADGAEGIKINGTASAAIGFDTHEAKLESGKTYTLSVDNVSTLFDGFYVNYMKYNGDTIIGTVIGPRAGVQSVQIICDGTFDTIRVRPTVDSGKTVNNAVLKFKVEEGSTVTTWTPYSNICPISGHTGAVVTRTGKNLMDCSNAVNATAVVSSVDVDGTVHFKDVSARWSNVYIGKMYVIEGQIYAISANIVYGRLGLSTTELYPRTGNLPDLDIYGGGTAAQLIFHGKTTNSFKANFTGFIYLYYCSDTNYDAYHQAFSTGIMVELGSTATAFEPYQGLSVTIPFGQTVYGGNLTLHQDGSGEVVVDHGIVDLGTLTWRYNQASLQTFDTDGISSVVAGGNDIVCSSYPLLETPLNTSSISSNDMFIRINKQRDGTKESGYYALGAIVIKNTNYSDATSFKTAMSGIHLVYELATPITISLTASQITTLLGHNNIWADCGDVSVVYPADTKLYIDGQQTEDDMTANANIPNGYYFQVGNTLYKATAAIAQGETIIPGTNCTRTTFAEALNLLAAQ